MAMAAAPTARCGYLLSELLSAICFAFEGGQHADIPAHRRSDDALPHRRLHRPLAQTGNDPAIARQCRKRRCLVRLGPTSRASLSRGAPRYARLWRLDGDAARLSVDARPADRGFHE